MAHQGKGGCAPSCNRVHRKGRSRVCQQMTQAPPHKPSAQPRLQNASTGSARAVERRLLMSGATPSGVTSSTVSHSRQIQCTCSGVAVEW